MRKRFDNYNSGGSVTDRSPVDPSMIPMADDQLQQRIDKSPSIFGPKMPSPNARQGVMGDVNAVRTKETPKSYAANMQSRKRMGAQPATTSGLGSLMGGGSGRQAPAPTPASPSAGDQWMSQLWSGLSGPSMGYQAGGEVTSPGMEIYEKAMSDLESGGIGYAQGGSVIPGAESDFQMNWSGPTTPEEQFFEDPGFAPSGDWAVNDTGPTPTPARMEEQFSADEAFQNWNPTPTPARMEEQFSADEAFQNWNPSQSPTPAPIPQPIGTPSWIPSFEIPGIGNITSPVAPRPGLENFPNPNPGPSPLGRGGGRRGRRRGGRRGGRGGGGSRPGLANFPNPNPGPGLFGIPIVGDLPAGGYFASGGVVTSGAQQANAPGSPMNQQMGLPGAGADYSWAQPVPQNVPDYTGIQGLAHGGEVRKASDLAQYGRNGDTTLMHVNPAELQGLQSLMGPVTENPVTGLPEAFAWVPFLVGATLGAVGGGAMSDWDPKAIAMGAAAGGAGGAFLGPGAGAGASASIGSAIPAGGAAILPEAAGAVGGTFAPGVGGAFTPGAITPATLGYTAAPGALSQGSTAGAGQLLASAGLPQTAQSVPQSAMSQALASNLPTSVSTKAASPGIGGLLKANAPKMAKAGASMIGGSGERPPQQFAPPPVPMKPKNQIQQPVLSSARPPTPGMNKSNVPRAMARRLRRDNRRGRA